MHMNVNCETQNSPNNKYHMSINTLQVSECKQCRLSSSNQTPQCLLGSYSTVMWYESYDHVCVCVYVYVWDERSAQVECTHITVA